MEKWRDMRNLVRSISVAVVWLAPAALAQIDISIETSDTVASGIKGKYGLNVNAGVDADTNRPPGARSLSAAISEYGARHLRFPGGKKSLYYVWAAPPYTNADTHYWVPGWYADAALDTMNFDEFIDLCQQTGAEPHINVAYNSSAGLGSALAAEWVRYANVTKGYNVKYWEIGNEMWKSDLGFTTETLVAVATNYSSAMKTVDPTIKIGVSWKSGAAQTLINLCGSALDFFHISNYATYGDSFDAYRTATNMSLSTVNEGLTLNTIVSEYNVNTWISEPENNMNTTGKGLIVFDTTAQLMKSVKCEYACLWNTRWYSMSGGHSDSFGDQNELLPSVMPLKLYEMFLEDRMVTCTSSGGEIVSYATFNPTSADLSIFLINKETSSRNVNIAVTSGSHYSDTAILWRYSGTNYMDTSPTLGPAGTVIIDDNSINSLSLPSASITMIKLISVEQICYP